MDYYPMFEFYSSICSIHKSRNFALTFMLKTNMILLIMSKILCAESNTSHEYIFYELIYDEPNSNNPELTMIEKYFNFEVNTFLSYLLYDLKKTEGSYKDYKNEACEKLKTWIDKSKGFKQCQDKEYQSFYDCLESFIKCAKDTNVKNKAEYEEKFSMSFIVYNEIKIEDTQKVYFAQFIRIICCYNRLKADDLKHINYIRSENLRIKDLNVDYIKIIERTREEIHSEILRIENIKNNMHETKNKTFHIISLHAFYSRFLRLYKQSIQEIFKNQFKKDIYAEFDKYHLSCFRDLFNHALPALYIQDESFKLKNKHYIIINNSSELQVRNTEKYKFKPEICTYKENILIPKMKSINYAIAKETINNNLLLLEYLNYSYKILQAYINESTKIVMAEIDQA